MEYFDAFGEIFIVIEKISKIFIIQSKMHRIIKKLIFNTQIKSNFHHQRSNKSEFIIAIKINLTGLIHRKALPKMGKSNLLLIS